jgi:hypothetical protein
VPDVPDVPDGGRVGHERDPFRDTGIMVGGAGDTDKQLQGVSTARVMQAASPEATSSSVATTTITRHVTF